MLTGSVKNIDNAAAVGSGYFSSIPTKVGYCPIQDYSLNYEIHGNESKDKILLVMGLLSSMAGWASIINYFNDNLPVDNRGIGKSTCGSFARYTTKGMANDIKCVLEHAGWIKERSGGFISLELAYLLPSRFKSMTLLVTAAKFRKPPKYHWHTEKQLLKYRPGHNIIETFIEICFSDNEFLNDVNEEGITNKEALTKQLEGIAGNHRPNIYTIFGQSAALRTHNVEDSRLQEIGKLIPDIVVIGAEEDKLIDPDSSRHLAKYLDCKSVIVPGKGHAIIMEGRNETIKEMLEIFQRGNKQWL
ncbi:hypothetical protein HK103_004592 [Boothiomyces macroporosus]|uniref:Uncharacterized protein n=1 Tax=Boothiomyces macroporosus TaxID=261099 RepID=A0AAD5UG94_9FUNG|nr:hypothetical protein HK103_004592 [Boothiomyces macroporosus]